MQSVIVAAAASADAVPLYAELCGWAAGAVGVATGFPQAWRLWVGRQHHGLSVSSNVLTVVFMVAWSLYGIASGRTVQVASAGVGLVVAVVILLGHLVLARPRTGDWLPLLAGGIALVAVVALLSEVLLGLTAAALTIGGAIPQVVVLARARRLGVVDATGVARARWALTILCNALWFVFGLAVGDWVIPGNAAVLMALSLAIIVLASGPNVSNSGEPAPAPVVTNAG